MSTRHLVLVFGGRAVAVELIGERGHLVARAGDTATMVTVRPLDEGVYAIAVGGRRTVVHHASDGTVHHLQMDGHVYTFQQNRPDARRGGAVPIHHQDLLAPMPGIVTRIFVEGGQAVAAGDPLFVVEAMKMENVVRAPRRGRVTRIRTGPGSQVEGGAIVVEVADA
jgi:biotin carboxyl carrier protein